MMILALIYLVIAIIIMYNLLVYSSWNGIVKSFIENFPFYIWRYITKDGFRVWILFVVPSIILSEIVGIVVFGLVYILFLRIR